MVFVTHRGVGSLAAILLIAAHVLRQRAGPPAAFAATAAVPLSPQALWPPSPPTASGESQTSNTAELVAVALVALVVGLAISKYIGLVIDKLRSLRDQLHIRAAHLFVSALSDQQKSNLFKLFPLPIEIDTEAPAAAATRVQLRDAIPVDSTSAVGGPPPATSVAVSRWQDETQLSFRDVFEPYETVIFDCDGVIVTRAGASNFTDARIAQLSVTLPLPPSVAPGSGASRRSRRRAA